MTATDTPNPPLSTEFTLQRIYALVSSEVPEIPEVFEITEAPHLDINFNVQSRLSTSKVGNYIIELTIVVTTKQAEKTLFLIEVKQGGIFKIHGFDEVAMAQIINVHCPTILYPYASALVSDLVLRAGFMPLRLPLVDFNALYEQQKSAQSEQTSQ